MLSFGRAAKNGAGGTPAAENGVDRGPADASVTDEAAAAETPIETVRRLRRLRDEMSDAIERLAVFVETPVRHETSVRPETSARTGEPSVGGVDWRGLLFETASLDEPPEDDLQKLVDGLERGDVGAAGLVGRLLAFRAADAEELPILLKDVGEAYYGWSNQLSFERVALREALIRRLIAACGRAGMGHRIETVRVGDRFDRSRHQATAGGWEITVVRGWVVLRDNGSVYTKAEVETR
jgi:hypothetical protein